MRLLSGDEIVENWPFIKKALEMSALPTADTNEEKLKNILRSLLSGGAMCWVSMNGTMPKTVIITTIGMEGVSGTKNLLVYCAHGFQKESSEMYIKMAENLGKYAKAQGCDNVLLYVWNDKLKAILEEYGAVCDYSLAVFPLIEKINVGD